MGKSGPNLKKMVVTSPVILTRLGAMIRNARKASGISRLQVCETLEVSNSQLSAWEGGRAEPRFFYIIRLCSLLKINLDTILETYGTEVGSTDVGSLITKYHALSEDSRENVKSIVDALYFSEVMGKKTEHTSAEANDLEDSIIEDNTSDDAGIEEDDVITPGKLERILSSKSETEETPVKRGRGRPRKAKPVTVPSTPVKRGRGRPRKVESTTTVPTEPVKRGRPRKVEAVTVPAAPAKRGRGRPRKTDPVIPDVTTVKRGRGRPRKTPS